MPALSAPDAAILRSHPVRVLRYVSIAPRTIVYQAQLTDPPQADPQLGSYIALPVDTGGATGNPADALAGYTVEVGTVAGGRDIGTTRLRASGLSGNVLRIAETGPTELSAQAGHYVTVRRERRIWQKLQRLVGSSSGGSEHQNSFTVYKDYDIAYVDQTLKHPPLANVDYKPAGWVDAGETYRTVLLDGSGSEAVSPGASISSFSWTLPAGVTLAPSYALTDDTIEVRAEAGCYELALTVTDSVGATATRYCIVWSHDANYPPLTNFAIERDDTEDWREMDIAFFEDGNTLPESAIPEGAQVCYWEQTTFNGQPAPDQYRDQMLGWSLRDAVDLRRFRSGLRIALAGAGAFLAQSDGPQLTLQDTAAPARWDEMANITDNRLIVHLLHWHSTALSVCNLYQLAVAHEWGEQNVNRASLWEQVRATAQGSAGRAGSDSLNGIWLRRHPSYMTSSDRSAVPTIASFAAADLLDEEGMSITFERPRRVGKVKGGGGTYSGGVYTPYASMAPGDAPSHGISTDEPPAWALPLVNSQLEANRLTGWHYGYLNNQIPELPLRLIANFDAIEPAWREWVTMSYDLPNVRGLVWSEMRFVPVRVSVVHNNDPGLPPREVTLTLEAETDESPGATAEVEGPGGWIPGEDDYTPPWWEVPGWYDPIPEPPPFGWWLPEDPSVMGLISSDGYFYWTTNFDDDNPTWNRWQMVTDSEVYAYAFDAAAVDDGQAFWIATTGVWGSATNKGKIYRVEHPFDPVLRTVVEQFDGFGWPAQSERSTGANMGRVMDASFSEPGFVVCVTHYQDHGTYITRTTDGENWSAEQVITPHIETSLDFDLNPALQITSKAPGEVYAGALEVSGLLNAAVGALYHSVDYGATFNKVTNLDIDFGLGCGEGVDMPFTDNPNNAIFYYTRRVAFNTFYNRYAMFRTNGATKTDVTPIKGTTSFGRPMPRGGLVSCLSNPNTLLGVLAGEEEGSYQNEYLVFISHTAGDSWDEIVSTASDYRRGAIAGSNCDVLYLFGANKRVAFSNDGGQTLQDKTGDMVDQFGLGGTHIAIIGGP